MENDPLRPFVVGVWQDQLVERTGDTPLSFNGAVLGRHVADTNDSNRSYRTVIYQSKPDNNFIISTEFFSLRKEARHYWAGVSKNVLGLQDHVKSWSIVPTEVGYPMTDGINFQQDNLLKNLRVAFDASVSGAYKDANLNIKI